MANRLERGIDRAGIGTTIADPDVDFASLARGLGVWAEGSIDRPGDLAGSLERALAVVKTGRPALVDVITQVRLAGRPNATRFMVSNGQLGRESCRERGGQCV